VISGYVNAVARESRILPSPKGRFIESIMPKTFQKALLKAENVLLLFNHDRNKKLGSIKEGNLELREDSIGLYATATVTDQEVIESARKGLLKGWSFGMAVNNDKWQENEDGIARRFIDDLDLVEVSVLTKVPAYVATTIESRQEDVFEEVRGFEDENHEIADQTNEKPNNENPKEENRDLNHDFDSVIKQIIVKGIKHT
jgi:HK97 family phage prohead protease